MPTSASAAPREPGDPHALRRHMAAIADLGRKAVSHSTLDDLCDEAAELVARALGIDYVAVVEDLGDELLLRSHRGWPDSAIFTDRLPRSHPSQAAYTLDSGEAVVLADAAAETRFEVSQQLRDFGIVSGISVPVGGSERPFGLIAAHARERRTFNEDEIVFLRLLANVLAAKVEMVRASDEMRRREHILRTLVEHGPDIVMRLDRDLRYTYVSPALTAATGLPAEALVGKTISESGFPPELVALLERELRPVLATAEPSRFEFRFGRRWLEVHAVAEPREDGGVESIVAFSRDRTEAHEADDRYRELFELATEMIFLLDADGRYVDVNPAVVQTLGYARDELIGMHFGSLVPPDYPDEAERFARKQAGDDSTASYESALRGKTGEVIPVQTSSRSIVRDGSLVGVLAICRDMREQKAARAALEASERQFRSAFENAAVGMLLTTPAGTIVRANDAFARMLGYTAEELRGTSISAVTLPEDTELTGPFVEALVAGSEETYHGEERYVRRDGEVVWSRVSLSAVRSADGTVPYVVAQVEDVTELRRVQLELRESQALHSLVVESSRDLITVFDRDLTVRLISPSVRTMLGYTPEEVVGTNLAQYVSEEDAPIAGAAIEALIHGADAELTQIRVRAADGGERLLEFEPSAVFDAEGNATLVVTVSRDVTDRMWLEEQLRQSQKMEAIGKLAGGVAHDFNNLLTAINGYSDIALAALPDDRPDIRHSIEEIRRAGERAAALTQQLLAFSRRQVLRPEALDLSSIVQGYLAMLERIVGEDIVLETQLGSGLPLVRADPGQLGQVLLNLVVNARDAMPNGGRLAISTAANEGRVTLTVADTGHGMDAETLRRAFEPFFTTKEPGRGTGMGLSTVHGIVEQSGGTVAARSQLGGGTSFRVSFPARAEAAAPAARAELPPPPAEPATILLVEDEPLVRGIVEEMLRALGHRVLAATTPREALEVAAAGEQFDLVLTDVVMPEMSGHELASRLAELVPGARVLYTSGYPGEAVEARGVLGARDWFLQKPFTIDALDEKVRTALATGA